MYVVLDNTHATMGDLIGFDGYMNTTTPFTLKEHEVQWKSDRRYHDFNFGNEYNDTCSYPRFWLETGLPADGIKDTFGNSAKGCFNSEFDQYGDTEAFGVFPDWQRQLSKFASVQDRLREWQPSVQAKLQRFSCLALEMLDFDGWRFDKATQITVDAQGEFSHAMRECAQNLGKKNFFLPGEITGGNTFASIYLGRGRQPDMLPKDIITAVTMTNKSDSKYFIRDLGKNALDAGAFHYTIYRSLTRFLGMDGNLAAGYDAPLNWVDAWNTMLLSNDFVNANTGVFDPRHMYGVTNQDVFRWPAITNGTQRMLLGLFITTIHMPGIPKLTWGEEQAFYILDNTADNYIFGRQAMSASLAWEMHGCYSLDSSQYYQMPLDAARRGCHDDQVSLDHRDPSSPVRNIIKSMYHMREQYPVLNDGYFLQQLSNQTHFIQYPGSNTTLTEVGIWSTMRSGFPDVQDLSGTGKGNQSVWLLYHNDNVTRTYTFDCTNNNTALISLFDEGTTVKNLIYPHDELTLKASSKKLGIAGSTKANGCVDQVSLKPYEFRVYVPKEQWVGPPPMITKFLPGHDARVQSKVAAGKQESVDIEIHFSQEMNCDSVTSSVYINSTTEDLRIAQINNSSIKCSVISTQQVADFIGSIPTNWTWKATLDNVSNGVHQITVRNASTEAGNSSTNSVDHFMFRIGQADNPIVFPKSANYTRALLHQYPDNGTFYVTHKAAGADKWRYSLNWGSSWSGWMSYAGGNNTLDNQTWSGTKAQQWDDQHLMVQYWGKLAGSSSVLQHADLNRLDQPPRRFPHLFAHGPFNQYGYDAGLKNDITLESDGRWHFHFMSEWPDNFQINAWGMNPDGKPDQSFVYGDVDDDGVLDRLPPSSLADLMLNISEVPPSPALAWQLSLDDGNYSYKLIPVGNRYQQLALFILMWIIPVLTAVAACWVFMRSFYGVKFNEIGLSEKTNIIPMSIRKAFKKDKHDSAEYAPIEKSRNPSELSLSAAAGVQLQDKRRCVLIATMEYDIEDWAIKIKIGGLGVMAQLMGKNLQHQDLIWVVPCVGGIDYPTDQVADPMEVTIMGKKYEVQIQYHILRNITYVLLDAPVFRKQTKSEPYPPRMDDMDSAIYYSAWNQCIAQTIKRFPVDLYHINDYHGAVAPLHLLPDVVPCCLSLHNAEFQGLWPMRTPKERQEVCDVFALDQAVVAKYVQFGSVFNLLHAGASYLRVHQKGFGAVGVSKKYGKRSFARYPIFWGLTKVGKLPNPDPTDTAEWDKQLPKEEDIHIDPEFEAGRAELKRQAQEWAGLTQNPKAELFVFVGRWSTQKGIDLIADIFPAVLEKHPDVQLVCVGPVIDLYGKFAALKLGKMMEKYPGRVYSKPEFTALPPYIFSGAEFALIPSRDEPFGLVAVEFGRKGALGVGARVGGLGQMPGWWYTVESTTTTHLLHQFGQAIDAALASNQETRAMMRARSAKQRFPVQQWKEDLETLQTKSIKLSQKEARKENRKSSASMMSFGAHAHSMHSTDNTPLPSGANTPRGGHSRSNSFALPIQVPDREGPPAASGDQPLSLGIAAGPGHSTSPPRKLAKKNRQSRLSTVSSVYEDDESDGEGMRTRDDEYIITEEDIAASKGRENAIPPVPALPFSPSLDANHQHKSLIGGASPLASPMLSPVVGGGLFPPPNPVYAQPASVRNSALSLDEVVGNRTDFKLQKVDPFFTDSTNEFYDNFEKRLSSLNGKNSEHDLCIEEYLVKSERQWFDRFRDARLGRSGHNTPSHSPAPSIFGRSRRNSQSSVFGNAVGPMAGTNGNESDTDEFLLGKDYKPPTGFKKYLQMKVGDWPAYSFLLAFGQIIAANSYQVTLLTGEVGQTATKLYVVASIYLVTSIGWWIAFRSIKATYVLSLPFLFYGFAFLLVGLSPFAPIGSSRAWVQNIGTAFYAWASSSGSLFFALNFGDEGGAPVKDWVFRACCIQGTQQIYVVGLWYWGSVLTKATAAGYSGTTTNSITSSPVLAAVAIPIAVFLWFVGILVLIGLPDFYRQAPGAVPSFYKSLFRRKIILWFFVAVIIQNYFLSAPYGRNWSYLWSSRHAPAWAIVLLVILFFIVLWALFLWGFGILSTSHSWILPIFAIGLGAPRWCQMLWGVSNIGLYVPWAGGHVASALAGRSLWLWLGLLDTVQGVGLGMILLQTLTRIHVAFTLIAAQVFGSIATILARATAPNKVGPGDVFPDFSVGAAYGVSHAWFWVGMLFQLVICIGFFAFFRKEQLSKP